LKVRWREFGKNSERTFSRKIDAIKLQSELLHRAPPIAEFENILFEDFSQIWIRRHFEVNVEKSTAKGYVSNLKATVMPFFKGKALAAIDEDDAIKYKEFLTVEK
jgi:hypothetical protein